jgi:hypothetical protein
MRRWDRLGCSPVLYGREVQSAVSLALPGLCNRLHAIGYHMHGLLGQLSQTPNARPVF